MKNFKIYLAYVALLAMVMTSCSKEDNPDSPDGPDGEEMVALSFTGMLSDFTRKVDTKQAVDAPVEGCFENSDPKYVRVGVKDDLGDWVTGGYIDIPVIPVSVDSDGDGADNYLTFEAEELELEEGNYTLEYFAVYNSDNNLILMAPRSDNNYGPYSFDNFVDFPLPQDIDLIAGTKHYQEVEVLCYDEQDVQEYGYLFFDFEELPLTYICFFGNECDNEGRHRPSHFRVKVWEYPSVPGDLPVVFNDDNILVNDVNDYNNGENSGDEITQADPLCIPLPDRNGDGDTWFYGEIYSIDAQGNEELIRRGDFTDEDTKDPNFEIDGKQKYWHFREGPYCGEDSDPCLLGNVVDGSEDFNIANSFDDVTIGDTEYAWSENTSEDPYGTYNIVSNAQDFYSGFPNLLDADNNSDGKFVVFDGDDLDPNETNRRVYYSQNIPTVCEGDMYYITMDLVDISTPNEDENGNDAQLKITANNVEVATFEISDLAGYDTWTKVGFTLMADSSGNIDFEIVDPDNNWEGNDFGMDNINISNDPTILNDIDHLNPGAPN
ncbi:hypothetical protein ACWBC2_11060 [Salegentibacter agarivorans]